MWFRSIEKVKFKRIWYFLFLKGDKMQKKTINYFYDNYTLILLNAGVKNEYRNNIWEYRNRVYESKVLYGMSYNHTTGTLTVPHGGLYYVYLHTTFYTRYSDKSQ